jgi:BMFP domain-containing protein YqiC
MSEETTKDLTPDDKLDQILQRLAALEAKTYDTRPIWEQAVKEITETRQEMNAKFRALDHKFDVLIKDLFATRTSVEELDSRVTDLERKQS